MASRGNQQTGMAGPQNGPPQQRMQNGGQPYGQPYGQPQQAPMWSSAAPTQPQFGGYTAGQPIPSSYNPYGGGPVGFQQQPTNTYNTTYNQPMTQAQPQQTGGLLEPTVADATPKPAAPATGNLTMPTDGKQETFQQPTVNVAPVNGAGKTNNVTGPLTAAQTQVQTPAAPTPTSTPATRATAYTPPPQPARTAPTYSGDPFAHLTPEQADAARRNNGRGVNHIGLTPRPAGTPDYTKDYSTPDPADGAMGVAQSVLRGMQQEASTFDYNRTPDAPPMTQGQQNLVNMGIHPTIARIWG